MFDENVNFRLRFFHDFCLSFPCLVSGAGPFFPCFSGAPHLCLELSSAGLSFLALLPGIVLSWSGCGFLLISHPYTLPLARFVGSSCFGFSHLSFLWCPPLCSRLRFLSRVTLFSLSLSPPSLSSYLPCRCVL